MLIIYSEEPNIQPIQLKMKSSKYTTKRKYIHINDPDLPNILYKYARYVIKGRWYEAEQILLKDKNNFYALLYRRNILEEDIKIY